MSLVFFIIMLPIGAQAAAMFFDEFYFHHKRGLPAWERIGHPIDSAFVLGTIAVPVFWQLTTPAAWIYGALAAFSGILVTKDEFVHSEHCDPGEQWLHALLFVLHPLIFLSLGVLWYVRDIGGIGYALPDIATSGLILQVQLGFVAAFMSYQIIYWNFYRVNEKNAEINNDVYHDLGERWYTANDDPIALLRAESKLLGPWVMDEMIQKYGDKKLKVLDVGCGAGFLTNRLAQNGHDVTGIDLSANSLVVAQKHDSTQSVKYLEADAYALPFPDNSFDSVSCMDFLEHVEDVDSVVAEISRVLKPQGLFFFHTFNRNPLSGFVVIKLVEWLVKNTPKNLHIYRMFVKPSELNDYCKKHALSVSKWRGVRPNLFSLSMLRAIFSRVVPKDFSFTFGSSLAISYCGFATKEK
jgi:2-polyprenyl-6-hydroxyphenyl methylase / 3-demethylubiquinone-9 3-methyltransferase